MTAAPVVIVGGGFGGLYTALALAARKGHPPILLIEPNERFLFLPLLYELFSGELRSWEIAPRYDALLAGKGVAWLQDRVSRINSNTNTVETRSGRQLNFSRLVIATGAATNSFGIPGVEAHSLGFRTLADVEELQQLVEQLRQHRRPLQRIAVVGAGASGVELACKLADSLEGAAVVELIERGSNLLPAAKSFNREQAKLALQRKDIRLRCHTEVVAVGSDHLELLGPQGPERLSTNGVIWTAGLRFEAPPIEPKAPAGANAAAGTNGRLACQADLQVLNHPRLCANHRPSGLSAGRQPGRQSVALPGERTPRAFSLQGPWRNDEPGQRRSGPHRGRLHPGRTCRLPNPTPGLPLPHARQNPPGQGGCRLAW